MTLKKQLALLAGIGLLLALVFWWEVPGFSSIKPGDPEADALGSRFQQNAVVFGELDGPVELVFCDTGR